MSIEPTQFEAAKMDGANAWQEFRYLTLPAILPVVVITTAFRAVDAFTKAFDIILATTGGGPGQASMVFPLYIWRTAFVSLHFGEASALAVIAIVISGAIGARSPRHQPAGRLMSTRRTSLRRKPSRRRRCILGALLFVTLLPIAWMAISAVKTDREINSIPPTFLPEVVDVRQLHAALHTVQFRSADDQLADRIGGRRGPEPACSAERQHTASRATRSGVQRFSSLPSS